MRYVAAYLLAVLGGNENPTVDDIKKILSSVGIDCDKQCVEKVVKELNGKKIDDLIAAGHEKLASASGMAVSAAATAVVTQEAAPAAGDAKEVEKPAKQEEAEESDEDMGFGLFD